MNVRQKKFGQKFIDIRPITRYNGSNLIEILINHYYRYLYYADCYWSHILCKEKEWFRRISIWHSNWIKVWRWERKRPPFTVEEEKIYYSETFRWRFAEILIPFLCQQKIADIAVLDPVSAHVELIQRDNIFLKL